MAKTDPATGRQILRAEGLVKRYRRRTVVDQVSIQVEQGQCVGLLGPNGAGKTTSFYMIVGMVRPDKGDVFLGPEGGPEKRLTRMPMYRRARLGLGYLAQDCCRGLPEFTGPIAGRVAGPTNPKGTKMETAI